MKQHKRFTFDTPMISGGINYGDVRISGIAYKGHDFDIDEVTYNGQDILPIIKYFNADSVNECDFIYNASEAHVSGIDWNNTGNKDTYQEVAEDYVLQVKGQNLD